MIVDAAPLAITPSTLPHAQVGSAFSQSIQASGGSGSGYVYSLASGTLPPGLSLTQAAGLATISGTPTTAGSYPFNFHVVDGAGNSANFVL